MDIKTSSAVLSLTAQQLVTAIKKKEISCEEVINIYLERIEQVNPKINAISQLDAHGARLQAATLDKTLSKKAARGKLIGVPITIKNACKTKGFSPNKSCSGLIGNPSTEDATVVARLRAEGAIILGLTNTPELSIGFETDNILYGRSNNPYNLAYSPGGSSGGEAAILAAQGSLLGIGSDATGSLRVPAHNTGITCLKATQGRIPFTGSIPVDAMGLFSQFISFGPMAKHIDDLCLALPILSGPDHRDPHIPPVALKNPDKVNLNKLKIAFYDNDGISTADRATQSTIKKVAAALNTIAQKVVADKPTILSAVTELLKESVFLGGDRGQWLEDILAKLNVNNPSQLLLEYLTLAKTSELTITELRNNWMKLDVYRQQMLAFMGHYDAILCPVAATPAKLHGKSFQEIYDFSYSMCYSLVNWPAVVVRAGTAVNGLPIGVQIIAKPWREDICLAIARYIETTFGGWQKPLIICQDPEMTSDCLYQEKNIC